MTIELGTVSLDPMNDNFAKIEAVVNEQLVWKDDPNLGYGDWQYTSGLGIDNTDPTVDNGPAIQAALAANRNLVIDTDVVIRTPVEVPHDYSYIKGTKGATVRVYGDVMKLNSAFKIKGQHSVVEGVTFDNPDELKQADKGRQVFVELQNDFNTVRNCVFYRGLNSVVGFSTYSPHGTTVVDNVFYECLGVGGGIGSDSAYGEDRGDAVTIWGNGTIIARNKAYCKEGEDARLGFHCEYPVSAISNPRPEWDGRYNIIAFNIVQGTFRRHFVMEGIDHGIMIGNISLGGATWWAEAYIQCNNVYGKNIVRYTRPAGHDQGRNWNPVRGAIGVTNFNKNVRIESQAIVDVGGSGRGVVVAPTTGDNSVRLAVDLLDMNAPSNSQAFYMTRPTDVEIVDSTVRGFGTAVYMTIGVVGGLTSKLNVRNSSFALNGTSAAFISNVGVGGSLWVEGTEISGSGSNVFSLANMTDVVLRDLRVEGGDYLVNIPSVSRSLIIDNVTNIASTPLAIRYAYNTSGRAPNVLWEIKDLIGVRNGFVVNAAHLTDTSSVLNQRNKFPGKTIVASDGGVYIALGGMPESGWFKVSDYVEPEVPPEEPTEPEEPAE